MGVQIIERWILARLRRHTFFSLAELNQCIAALLAGVNKKPFKQREGSRQEWFESIDKLALSPLPKQPYEYTYMKKVKVRVDCHVQYERHLYSVPHQLVGESLKIYAKDKRVRMPFWTGSCITPTESG